jgi:hypothetical protein
MQIGVKMKNPKINEKDYGKHFVYQAVGALTTLDPEPNTSESRLFKHLAAAVEAYEKEEILICDKNLAIKALHAANAGLASALANDELECRKDEDCDHCLIKSSQSDVEEALKHLG